MQPLESFILIYMPSMNHTFLLQTDTNQLIGSLLYNEEGRHFEISLLPEYEKAYRSVFHSLLDQINQKGEFNASLHSEYLRGENIEKVFLLAFKQELLLHQHILLQHRSTTNP